MNRLSQTKRFLTLILIGLFLFSCQKEKLEEALSTEQSETDVSIELATTVAKNFAFDQAFLQHPNKDDLKKSSFRTSDFKSDKNNYKKR